MVLKYKNKIYSSEDLPIFLFFKKLERKREFINELNNYNNPNTFVKINSVDVVLAGNTVIKDKRSYLYLSLETIKEKQSLQKQIFNTPEDSNAIISSPVDIDLPIIEQWVENNIIHLI
jgi:hypothetical protein